jgi:hypothetical protein
VRRSRFVARKVSVSRTVISQNHALRNKRQTDFYAGGNVMAKPWDQLSDLEKIEELRRDVLKTMGVVNQLNAHSDLLDQEISKIARRIDDLEHRTAEKESKKQAQPRRASKSQTKKGR